MSGLKVRANGAFQSDNKKCSLQSALLILLILVLVGRLQVPRDWSRNILIASAEFNKDINTTDALHEHGPLHTSSIFSSTTTDPTSSKVTLVTAFFPMIGSTRHSSEEYIDYMTKLFSNTDAMIIFTSHQYESTMRNLLLKRHQAQTLVVPMNLNETRSFQMFSQEFWYHKIYQPSRKIRSLGSNKGIVDHLPYVVWNSKVEFVKLASDENPFRSDFFVWIDAGLIRWEQYTNSTIVQRIPPELPRDKLLIMDVTPILSHKKYTQMSAGMFGGYKYAIDRYYDKYYQVMEEAGNSKDAPLLSTEQFLLHRTCLRSEGLCHIIVPMHSKTLGPALKFPYFYMLAFFNSMEYNLMESKGKIHPCNGMDSVSALQKCVERAATKQS